MSLILFLLLQISFNTAGEAVVIDTNVVTIENLVISSGLNKTLLAGALALDTDCGGATPYEPSSVTFNSTEGATKLISESVSSTEGICFTVSLYRLHNPSAVTANLVASWPVALAVNALCTVVLNGVEDIRTPVSDQDRTGVVTTTTLDVGSVADDWVVDIIGGWAHSIVDPAAGQTERANTLTTSFSGCAMSSKTATTTTTNMSWDITSGDWYATAGVALIPAAPPIRFTIFGEIQRAIH